jgi:hypothetical protein
MKCATSFAIVVAALASSPASATSLRGSGNDRLEVVIPGALREMSAADSKIFKDTLTSTFKDAYTVDRDVDFSFEKALPNLGWQCRLCRKDDDASAEDAPLRISVGWQCRLCRKDDDAASLTLGSATPAVHSAWEKAFCAKLTTTGAANFANARDCRINVGGDKGTMEQ